MLCNEVIIESRQGTAMRTGIREKLAQHALVARRRLIANSLCWRVLVAFGLSIGRTGVSVFSPTFR